MNNYLDVSSFAKERMNEMINGRQHVEPWSAFANNRRPSLLQRVRNLWQNSASAKPKVQRAPRKRQRTLKRG